jgi:mono/diheme cytochrome c family protein
MLARQLLLIAFVIPTLASAQKLEVKYKYGSVYTTEDLLKNSRVKMMTIPSDPTYKTTMRYKVLPFQYFLKYAKVTKKKELKKLDVKFMASDGFASVIPIQLLVEGESKAYIAIEEPDRKWPVVKDGKSAGPFYLVWSNPEKENIGQEQWPFQIDSITIQESAFTKYPGLNSPKGVSMRAREGMKVFIKNCFSCHTFNGEGSATMGPDLNYPMNPLEYFKEKAFIQLIRNPKSVRTWPDSVMPAFAEDEISDREIKSLMKYFKEMSKHKIKKVKKD